MKALINFAKREIILIAAWILAIASMFFVAPSEAYLSYIDLRSLGILWALMIIMAGLKENGFFIFTGNIGQLPVIAEKIASLIQGREVIGSVIVSQVISNVPAGGAFGPLLYNPVTQEFFRINLFIELFLINWL